MCSGWIMRQLGRSNNHRSFWCHFATPHDIGTDFKTGKNCPVYKGFYLTRTKNSHKKWSLCSVNNCKITYSKTEKPGMNNFMIWYMINWTKTCDQKWSSKLPLKWSFAYKQHAWEPPQNHTWKNDLWPLQTEILKIKAGFAKKMPKKWK